MYLLLTADCQLNYQQFFFLSGPKAVVNRTAVLVTFNEWVGMYNSNMWGGKMPFTCPKPEEIFESGSCYTGDKEECYVSGNRLFCFALFRF